MISFRFRAGSTLILVAFMTCDKIPAPQDVAGQQENEEGHCRCYHLNLMVVLSLYAVNAIIVEQQKEPAEGDLPTRS